MAKHLNAVFLVCGALAACAAGSIPSAQAQQGPLPRTKFVELDKPPSQGTWKAMCPQLVLPKQPEWEDQASMKVFGPNGDSIGAAPIPGGGLVISCPARGSQLWKQTVSVAPTSMAVDPYGNIIYTGTASGPKRRGTRGSRNSPTSR